MNTDDKAIKLVIGAGEYNNNPGWLHTQADELNLLDEGTWHTMFNTNSITAIIGRTCLGALNIRSGCRSCKSVS